MHPDLASTPWRSLVSPRHSLVAADAGAALAALARAPRKHAAVARHGDAVRAAESHHRELPATQPGVSATNIRYVNVSGTMQDVEHSADASLQCQAGRPCTNISAEHVHLSGAKKHWLCSNVHMGEVVDVSPAPSEECLGRSAGRSTETQ